MFKNLPNNPASTKMLEMMIGPGGKMTAYIVPIDDHGGDQLHQLRQYRPRQSRLPKPAIESGGGCRYRTDGKAPPSGCAMGRLPEPKGLHGLHQRRHVVHHSPPGAARHTGIPANPADRLCRRAIEQRPGPPAHYPRRRAQRNRRLREAIFRPKGAAACPKSCAAQIEKILPVRSEPK